MRVIIIASIILISVQFAFAQDSISNTTSGEVRIDDEDQVSGKFGTLMDGIETVEKAVKIKNAASTGVKIIAEGKKVLKEGVGSLKDRFSLKNLKGKLLVYKNEKVDFLATFNKAANRLDSVMVKVNDRVNMWRTTLPRLRGYKDAIGRLAERTTAHFKDFKWKDLIDIERTWDRETQLICQDWKGLGVSIYNYSRKLGKDGGETTGDLSWLEVLFKRNKSDQFRSKDEIQAELSVDIELEVLGNRDVQNQPHYFIPQIILAQSTNAMQKVNDIAKEYSIASGENSTNEDELFSSVEKEINDADKMITDERELQAKIESIKMDIEMQRASIREITNYQLQNLMRLEQFSQEEKALSSVSIKDALNMFSNEGVFRKNIRGSRAFLYSDLKNN